MPSTVFFCCSFLLCCTFIGCCLARDNITFYSMLDDTSGETLVSAREIFELGFFTPSRSSPNVRYVGIWYYKLYPTTFVWVANRDKPLSDSTGRFAVGDDGNLHVFDKSGNPLWSADFEGRPTSIRYENVEARLLDSGNLVLSYNQSTTILWQSFKQPVDTFLPGMDIGGILLKSWKSEGDPDEGNFTFGLDQFEQNQFVVWANDLPYWKSRESDPFDSSDEMPKEVAYFLFNFGKSLVPRSSKYLLNVSASYYINWRIVMNSTGDIQCWRLDTQQWVLEWRAPRDRCSIFNKCGDFGICNTNSNISCKCLKGFKPSNPKNWNNADFSDGCIRISDICGSSDNFLNLKKVKVGKPDSTIYVDNVTDCRTECCNKCECKAYSEEKSSKPLIYRSREATCWIWTDNLNNLQEEYAEGTRELFVRVANSSIEEGGYHKEFGGPSGKKIPWSLIMAATIGGAVVLSIIILCIWLWRRKMAKRRKGKENLRSNTEKRIEELLHTQEFEGEDSKSSGVHFFDFDSIVTATDNFSDGNKLGQGGFGPVYKGKFPGGQDIAIKRLSSVSGQGLEEFKNEVLLIARLQHRNLVRLLGYCLKGDERILLYEYMPNKSLDLFIFDSKLSELLKWEMRFNIILGVARGLLYLHQDSRLRIIHRDLKTANILLDDEMNPKISDFGLARIVEGKQKEASTNRVVGTYGYMAPEYAMDGLFSVKSDVFSFGVVVLEILSGKKNTAYFNLLRYAWTLWTENKALELLEETLSENCSTTEFSKCLNVALLCIQEDPADRPTMSNVVVLLGSETETFPAPKKPAFMARGSQTSTSTASSSKQETPTNWTTTSVEGR